MTDDEKYLEALKAFGELVNKKNNEISYYKYEINRLETLITKAEQEKAIEAK